MHHSFGVVLTMIFLLILKINLKSILADEKSDKNNESSTLSTITEYLTTLSYNSTEEDAIFCNDSELLSCNNTTLTDVQTTSITLTSTIKSKNETTVIPKFKKIPNYRLKDYFCSCDLQKNYCDINCCCDKDCHYEDRMVFGQCSVDEIKNKEIIAYCGDKISFGENYTHYIDDYWWIFNNNFLCVQKSNFPNGTSLQQNEILDFDDASDLNIFYKKPSFSWPDFEKGFNEMNNKSLNFTENFKFGNKVWLFKNNKIESFDIPDNFITNICLLRKELKYLLDTNTKCSFNFYDDSNHRFLFAEYYFKNLTFISSPKAFNNLWDKKKQKKCPVTVCISPEVTYCDGNFKNCKSLSFVGEKCTKNKSNAYYMNCKKVVKKVKYEIFHRGSQGITKVNLKINLHQNVTYNFENFSVEFHVKYFWHSYKLNYSNFLSGNPGYLADKPILISRLNGSYNFLQINSVNISRYRLKNDSVLTENLLSFPSDKYRHCVFNENNFTPVLFGNNFNLKCSLEEKINLNFNNKLSGIIVCRQIQKLILQYWSLYENSTLIFGKFGNSIRTTIEDWIGAYYSTNYTKIINETIGNFTKNNESLVCTNLMSKVNVQFFYKNDFNSVNSQNKIVGVVYNITKIRKTFEFSLKIKNKILELKIPMVIMVNFYNVAFEKKRSEIIRDFYVKNSVSDYIISSLYLNKSNGSQKLKCKFLFVVVFLIILIINK